MIRGIIGTSDAVVHRIHASPGNTPVGVVFPVHDEVYTVLFGSKRLTHGVKNFPMIRKSNEICKHFYLKPLTVEHLERIVEWYEDIEDLVLIESKLPVPVNAQSLAKAWQRDLVDAEPRTSYLFSIGDDNGEPLGYTGLQDINYAHGNGVVFVYIRKDKRRLGIALRSVALMLDLAFDQLRLHRVTTYVHAKNTPSVSLIQRIGFSDEGCMRESCFFDGEYSDLNIVGTLCGEWLTFRSSLSDALDDQVIVAFGRNGDTRWRWPLK